MDVLRRRWNASGNFANLALIGFVIVQVLDGALTYLAIHMWGPAVEANPLISSAISSAGPGMGLASAKLVAVGFGLILYIRQTYMVIALLTALYFAAAIVPWTLLFAS